MRRLPTLRPRVGMELLPTDRLASRSRLDTSPLQLALDDIESHLKWEHGKRRPTDDRSSRQDQKRRHLNLQRRIRGKPPTSMKWSPDKGIAVRVLLLRYYAASRLSEACKSSTASANYAKMRSAPRTPRRNCAVAVRPIRLPQQMACGLKAEVGETLR